MRIARTKRAAATANDFSELYKLVYPPTNRQGAMEDLGLTGSGIDALKDGHVTLTKDRLNHWDKQIQERMANMKKARNKIKKLLARYKMAKYEI